MSAFPVLLRPVLLASAVSLVGATTASAAEPPRTLIVMDGSGSMWGQIDGRAKLEIARETVAQVIGTLPAQQELGLIAYGHRSKGDCADIELIVPPAAGTADAVLQAVNSMRFLGKTPLSEAVRQAAAALRYTEAAATVVLVTDGLETCAADPCAVAAELERSGVDFTAHVIGFGLTDAEGAQVACLAENTGGRYLQASDGASLAAALSAVVTEPPQPTPPAVPDVLPEATLDAPERAPIGSPVAVQWTGPDAELDAIAVVRRGESDRGTDVLDYRYVRNGNPVTLTMPADPGNYELHYRYRDQFVVASRPIEAVLAEVSLDAPDVATAGTTVTIVWTGPNAPLDTIQVAEPGSASYLTYTYLGDGNEVRLTMPEAPGSYELRYVFRDSEVIATRPITVIAATP
jgi:Ca-activated chloride channel family protein